MENTTPESIEANIWNSSNQGGDIENWADFSSYEKPSEPMVTCKEEVETEPSSMPADSNQSEQPRPEFSGEPSVADSNIIE